MKIFGRKKNDLYLSDKQPLTVVGIIMLILSYLILAAWGVAIIWPLYKMVQSAFNGLQEGYIIMNAGLSFR